MNSQIKIILSLFLFFFTSCATVNPVAHSNHNATTSNEVLQQTPDVIVEEIPHYDGLKQKIATFKQKLRVGTALSERDWRLHDELLQAYASLKPYVEHQAVWIACNICLSRP